MVRVAPLSEGGVLIFLWQERRKLYSVEVAREWHGTGNGKGPAQEETPPELALLSVPPAGFEPATPALGERCSIP